MSKVISTTVVNPNGKEDTCAYAVVDSKELYYLLSPITAPDKYTISFFIKSLANETLTLWYGEESKEFEVTTSWQKITWNFSAEWVDNVMLQFTEGEYYIYNTMLERGNVATDYSMSQYDQKKVLKDMENTLNTKYAQLSIALDDITLEVSETSSKLGNVESSVKLMSDEIGLKVNKNGIIGAINLSSEQAQIMASKIDLVGAVTLSSLSSDVASKFDTLDDITVTDNNITYIDGGKIYTGSITADKIDVDNLFAQDIEATGSISGVTIISQTDMARIINENGEIKFQYKDTRGEGNFIDIGSIYAASLGDIYATGTWTFDDIELSNGQNVYVLSAPRYPITSGSDLNDYTTAGTYIKASSSITVKNEPSGITVYKLIVDELVDGGSGTRNVRQKVKSTISNVEYMRTGYYRSFVLIWTDWEKVVTTSDLPKTKTIKYNLQNMSWTKSSNGMYYVYIDITDMDILTVSRGNWNGMKDTDVVQVGKDSDTRIVISANRNNFDVNSAIEVVFLYT